LELRGLRALGSMEIWISAFAFQTTKKGWQ
jgi:hypothetical protein